MGHYFDDDPQVASDPREVVWSLPDGELRITTDRGVFGYDQADRGTKLLLLQVPAPPPAGDLLDLGCGAGPIALAMARRAPGATVWAVDVNERALALCRENAARHGLGNVHAVRPEGVPIDVRFAAIWSNPPIRIGKAGLHDLLATWLARLAPGADAHLVVQKHLGSDSLQAWLSSTGFPTERIAVGGGFRVLRAHRSPTPVTG